MSKPAAFRRPPAAELARRLAEPRRFIQVVADARQVAKTTLVQQVTEAAKVPVRFASADEPTLSGAGWIAQAADTQHFSEGSARAGLLPIMRAHPALRAPQPYAYSASRYIQPSVVTSRKKY